MLVQKMRVLLFLLYIGLGLTACDSFTSDSGGDVLPDVSLDVLAPTITNVFPKDGSTDIDVKSKLRFTFSELIDMRSLKGGATEDGDDVPVGIKLYADTQVINVPSQSFDERPYQVKETLMLGEGLDPLTNKKIDVKATVLSLHHKSGRFALNTKYAVVISEGVQDLAGYANQGDGLDGNKLVTAQTLKFTTQDGEWKANEFIQLTRNSTLGTASTDCALSGVGPAAPVEGDQFEPSLASNDSGDIFAVWRQNNQGGTNDAIGIWTNRYKPLDNQWNSSSGGAMYNTQRIDDVSLTTNAFGPKIAVNKQGKAVATWYQASNEGELKSVWLSVFEPPLQAETVSYQWSCAKRINHKSQDPVYGASSPEIGIDDEGNILAVWLELEDGIERLKSDFFNAVTEKWLDEPPTLNMSLGGDAKEPVLSYSSDGVAMLVWSQQDSGIFEIYARRFTSGVWGEPKKLSKMDPNTGISTGASKPKISLSENNDVFAIWQQHDGERENIWASRFSGGVWAEAFKMESDNLGDAFDPFIIFGPKDVVFAAWVQTSEKNGQLQYALNIRASSADTTWSEIEELDVGTIISKPKIAFDFEGNAVAVWINNGNTRKARYSHLTSSWRGQKGQLFVSKSARSAVLVPILKDGRFISIWAQFQNENGNFNLVSALFAD